MLSNKPQTEGAFRRTKHFPRARDLVWLLNQVERKHILIEVHGTAYVAHWGEVRSPALRRRIKAAIARRNDIIAGLRGFEAMYEGPTQ